ncbi:MAG: tetratricopeptide repeat protein, partial [Bacteroidota bacterium]
LTFISLLVLSTAFYIYDNASAWAEAQQEADVANTLLEFQQSMLYGGVKTTEYLADFGAYGGLFKDTLVMEEFVFDVAQQAKTKLADNPEAMIRMLTVAGGALTSMQALPQADSVFDMATSIAGVSDHARARLFRYMSAHKVNVNDSPGAIDFANRSLAMFEQQYGQQHVETARSMMTLATPYRRAGKLAEADSLYKLAGPILKSYKVGGSDPEVFLYSISHVQTLNELKEYTKADSIIQSLYTEVDTSFQDYDVLYAYLLETHATNHYRQHNFEKAVALKEKAIYHMEKALGPKDLYVATYKNNLGVLYTELGRQDKAVEIYEEALQIYRSFSVEDAMYIASSLSNISMLHLFLGNFDQSWSYATEVLSFQESVLQIDSSLYGLLAVNASIAAAVNKQYETAIRLSEQSKGLLSSKYPEDHHLIRIHTRGKAMALLMSGDHEKARDVAVQALRDTSSYHARNLLLYRTVLKGAYEGLGNTLLADSVRTVMNQNADPLSQKSFRFVAEALEQSVKIP